LPALAPNRRTSLTAQTPHSANGWRPGAGSRWRR
jgi:hypothetical protein